MTEITIGRNDKTVRIPCFRGLGGCGDRPRVEAIAQAIANKTGMTIDWPRIMARGRSFQAEAERRGEKWRLIHAEDFAFFTTPDGSSWALAGVEAETCRAPEDGHLFFMWRAKVVPCPAECALARTKSKRRSGRSEKADTSHGEGEQGSNCGGLRNRYQVVKGGALVLRDQYGIPTAAAGLYRQPFFEPSDRPRGRNGDWINLRWGDGAVAIIGRAGQRHADLIEFFMYWATRDAVTPQGTIEVTVDPADVRRAMGDHYNYRQLHKLIDELRHVEVKVRRARWSGQGMMLGDFVEIDSGIYVSTPRGERVRKLWQITIGKVLATMYATSVCTRRDPAVIASLPSGIAKAVARFLLTQRDFDPTPVVTVIKYVAPDLRGQRLYDAKRILVRDQKALIAVGVGIDEEGRIGRGIGAAAVGRDRRDAASAETPAVTTAGVDA